MDGGASLASSEAGASVAVDTGPPPCKPEDTQGCVCTDGSGLGVRHCQAGAFEGACESCAPIATPSGTLCAVGRYTGRYHIDEYLPAAAGFCGLFTLFGGPGNGEIAFTLGSTGSAEFVEIVQTESCLELTVENDAGMPDADGGVVGVSPLDMALSGKVDCATGELRGEVRGVYYSVSLCNGGTVQDYYPIKGTIRATFDPDTFTFKDGVLDLREPPQALDALGITKPAGGAGTFSTALDPDAGAPEKTGDCLDGKPFEDFPLDAGA
jgi:hypothetical protein